MQHDNDNFEVINQNEIFELIDEKDAAKINDKSDNNKILTNDIIYNITAISFMLMCVTALYLVSIYGFGALTIAALFDGITTFNLMPSLFALGATTFGIGATLSSFSLLQDLKAGFSLLIDVPSMAERAETNIASIEEWAETHIPSRKEWAKYKKEYVRNNRGIDD